MVPHQLKVRSTWMPWATVTHTHRWHAHYHNTGEGPVDRPRNWVVQVNRPMDEKVENGFSSRPGKTHFPSSRTTPSCQSNRLINQRTNRPLLIHRSRPICLVFTFALCLFPSGVVKTGCIPVATPTSPLCHAATRRHRRMFSGAIGRLCTKVRIPRPLLRPSTDLGRARDGAPDRRLKANS